jgi:hypothetical protein
MDVVLHPSPIAPAAGSAEENDITKITVQNLKGYLQAAQAGYMDAIGKTLHHSFNKRKT